MTQDFNFILLSQEWIKTKATTVKPTTMAAYSLIIEKHLVPFYGDFERIGDSDIKNFIEKKMKEGLSAKSIKDIMVVLKMILKFIKSKGYEVTSTDKILLPKEFRVKELPVFTIEQESKLLSYLNSNFSLKNLGIFICLNTGLRIGEICALKWQDIDLERGFINVNKTLCRIYRSS